MLCGHLYNKIYFWLVIYIIGIGAWEEIEQMRSRTVTRMQASENYYFSTDHRITAVSKIIMT